jgi:hypothetical protein
MLCRGDALFLKEAQVYLILGWVSLLIRVFIAKITEFILRLDVLRA